MISIFIINPSFAIQLLSHKATYTLNVENIKKNTFLKGGQGQTYFQIKEFCDGWKVKEDYILMYELTNKKTANSISSFTTFENKKATKHSFELTEMSELNGQNDYQGFLEKNNKNITGSIINKNIKKISFKKNILFPIEHLQKVIEKAQQGKTIFTSDVFFGNEDKDFIKTVSAFIGKKKEVNVLDLKNTPKRMVWPIRLAFYKNNKNKINPDYEISIDIDKSGVIYSYTIFYEDFEVKANLSNLKTIEKQICR